MISQIQKSNWLSNSGNGNYATGGYTQEDWFIANHRRYYKMYGSAMEAPVLQRRFFDSTYELLSTTKTKWAWTSGTQSPTSTIALVHCSDSAKSFVATHSQNKNFQI